MLSKLKSFLLRSVRNSELWTFAILALTSWQSSAALLRYVSEPDIWDESGGFIRHAFEIVRAESVLSILTIENSAYSLWYAFLLHFESDPFHLYYFNGRLLAFLLPLALYAACRSMRMGVLASALAAISLLLFPPLLTINRWNNHFLILYLLVAFSMIARIQDKLRFAASFVVLNVIATFVRSELQIGVLVSVVFLLYEVVRNSRWKEKSSVAPVAAAMIAFGIFVHQFKHFVGKSRFAFFDFTSRRYPEWHELPWHEIIERLYGPNVETPIQAFIANPIEMLKHMAFHGSIGLSTFSSMLLSYGYLVESFFGWMLLASFLIIGGLLFAVRKSSLMTKFLGERVVLSERFLLFAAILILPTLASICVFGSTPRYLLPSSIALFILVFSFFRRDGRLIALLATALTCILCFVVPADYNVNTNARLFFGNDNRSLYGQHSARASILAFRAIRLNEPRFTLAVDFGGQVYVDGINFASPCWDLTRPCYGLDKDNRSNLRELIDFYRVNEVFLDYRMQDLVKGGLKNEELRAQLKRFFEIPGEYDFARIDIPCTENAIFVRNHALHPDQSPECLQAQITEAVSKEVNCQKPDLVL